MIYSRRLLETFLPKLSEISDEELSNAISSTGNELPLKDIHKHPVLNNLVIGRILSFEKHPNSDHLNVCKVQINKQGIVNTIVCGASNVQANRNVIVALNGAILHDGRIIEYKEVRGIRSEGMLCGYYELTPLNNKLCSPKDSEGIMLFDEGEIGDTNVTKFLGFDDTIYEIEIPFANRNDPNGVLSLCQDLAGYFKWNFEYPEPFFKKENYGLKVRVQYDESVCNGFVLAKLENVKVTDSDWKTKSLLMNNGVKPLNTLLDTLSYITLLTNVPTAAYDLGDKPSIKVCLADSGSTFVGFDSKEYKLNENDIIVKDKDKIICLAGILGDKNHGVSYSTTTSYIEFANFNFVNIRNTSSKYNIRTDAARRNSKKITNFSTMVAASMIQNYFSHIQYNIKMKAEKITPIKIDVEKINELIGSKLSKQSVMSHLKGLGFKFKSNNMVIPPLYRNDVVTNSDLAEEVTKSIDVNEIEEQPIDISGMREYKYTEYYFISKFWNVLTNNYFFETKSYNTTNKASLDKFNVFNYMENVEIISSNNINREVLRNNLIHSLLNIYKYNLSYKNELLPIFELQKIYQGNKNGIKNLTLLTPENLVLDKINKSKLVYNINGLKSVIDQIVSVFNVKVSYKAGINKYFYDNESVEIIYNHEIIGYIGSIKKTLLNEYGINENIYAATINWDALYSNFTPANLKITPISNLMPIIKDITFIAGIEHMKRTIDEVALLEYVENIEFIDKFTKDGVTTYTIRFFLKNKDKIENAEIDKYMNTIISIFESNGINIKK